MIKEIDKSEEPPKIAVKFANIFFLLGALFSILLIVFAIYKIYNHPGSASRMLYIISILSGLMFAILFGLGLKRLSNDIKVNLSILFFTIGITVYGFETYLELSKKTDKREFIALQKDVPYDKRSKIEVIDDLKDSRAEVYPNIYPENLIASNGLNSDNGLIYPLGTISNSTTILDNESGYYPIVETDEHGFNNPKGLYIENKVDIILTGDSLTEGCCVQSDETISAMLRKLNFNTISVGKGGNGPLVELAALKEYAEPLKPKIVLWLYYVNDFNNLNTEKQSSILKKYLYEDNYSQNLITRQEEIDEVLINYVQSEQKKFKNRKTEILELIIKITKLTKLRKIINLKPTLTPIPSTIFKDILQKSKQMVSSWGGRMYLVYLPEYTRYTTGDELELINHDFVIETAIKLDIPIIDIHKEVFDTHQDLPSLFPFRVSGHYNAKGYKLVAETIEKRLKSDNYVPIK